MFRVRPARALLALTLAACGKPEALGSSPQHEGVEPAAPADERADAGEMLESTAAPGLPRVAAEVEFHRARVAAGPGFWVLGMLHNQHPHALADVRAQVRMRDAEGKLLAQVEAAQQGRVAAGAWRPVVVHVDAPVEHEQLELLATAVRSETGPLPLPIELEYDPPQRAELGGWFVLGQLTNTGAQTIEGARLEVRGLDEQGRLLGVDWLAIEPLGPGVARPFDLGELRYEQTPARFELELRAS